MEWTAPPAGIAMCHVGDVSLRKKLRCSAVLDTFRTLKPCLVGMEACATAHFWAREISALGHLVSLCRQLM